MMNVLNSLLLFLAISLLPAVSGWSAAPRDFDLIKLNNGSVVEGSLLPDNGPYVEVDCVGGTVSLPHSTVDSIIQSKPGESEILLAQFLLQRGKLDRAKQNIDKANVYPEWKDACQKALREIEANRERLEEERREKEKREIERIIEMRGLEAGIEALKRRNQDEDEYWGKERGRLHILMAMDRLDHLDFRAAEHHLNLAERYGADPKEWNAVRKQILAMKRISVLHGRDYLASKYGNKPPQKTYDSSRFLAKVMQDQEKGNKIPPVDYLKFVDRYSQENSLDPLLVWAMIDTESSWRPSVVSDKGAQGLMQLMPSTAKDLDVSDPFNPEENIRGGTQYMRFLMKMFNDVDSALAAYNTGPGRVERNGITDAGKRYIQKVRSRYAALRERYG